MRSWKILVDNLRFTECCDSAGPRLVYTENRDRVLNLRGLHGPLPKLGRTKIPHVLGGYICGRYGLQAQTCEFGVDLGVEK